jgi:phage shock protein PspC (stress-responsive transcriptional regulator)
VLRRSRNDRVAAGVAGGLGEYFGVDPVLFRVLIATASFFGGAGVLAYLVAWAAIPEQGAVNAPIDRFVAGLRRRRVPVWLVAIAAGLALWAAAFSWWAPDRFFPLIAVVIVLVAIFGRRARRRDREPSAAGAPWDAPPVRLDKTDTSTTDTATETVTDTSTDAATAGNRPAWIGETRQWMEEAKQASRERRRRSWPIRITMICTLVATIGVLAVADAVSGIAIPAYFWAAFGITLGGLLVGMVLRRTPWSMIGLLIPSVLGLIAFAPTSASLHDGSGQRDWTPTSASELKDHYRLAFGQGVLDLTRLGPLAGERTVNIRLAAGQVRIVVPRGLNAVVHAKVHLGQVEVDGNNVQSTGDDWHRHGGWGLDRTVFPPSTATGAPLTVNVDIADGDVSIDHRG